jgi:hypothetical protein
MAMADAIINALMEVPINYLLVAYPYETGPPAQILYSHK